MKQSRGFTLIEVVIAIFILTVGVGGVFALVQQLPVSSSFNRSKLTAYYMAQEGLEAVRNIRDSNLLKRQNWTEGILGTLNPRIPACDFYGDINFDGVVSEADAEAMIEIYGRIVSTEQEKRADLDGSGNIDISDWGILVQYIGTSYVPPICQDSLKYQRTIEVSQIDQNTIEVLSRVVWGERGRTHEVEAITQLTDWK